MFMMILAMTVFVDDGDDGDCQWWWCQKYGGHDDDDGGHDDDDGGHDDDDGDGDVDGDDDDDDNLDPLVKLFIGPDSDNHWRAKICIIYVLRSPLSSWGKCCIFRYVSCKNLGE